MDPGPSFWLRQDPYQPSPALAHGCTADVAIVGGGFTGLWTAIELGRRAPQLRTVVLEQGVVGYGASGRNGGFCEASLTHGHANGVRHFPGEVDELERLGELNFRGLADFIAEHAIACDFEETGLLELATSPAQADELRQELEARGAHDPQAVWLDASAVQQHLRSPLLLGGVRSTGGSALLNPARLARGLRRVAEAQGVRVYEQTPVRRIRPTAGGVELRTAGGSVRARRVVLATNAYSGALLRRLRRRFVPVYDYILVSEPLTARQRERVGWAHREGAADRGNHFHYFRLTADDRILWGGYDAIYHFGGRVGPAFDHRAPTYSRLEAQFRAMFPQLHDLRFSHRWGGPIASTTRFTCTFGSAFGGRLLYALGYTGLGVAATRFAARVLGDQLLDPDSPLLRLRFVRRPPFPFPPEPLRVATLAAVQAAMTRADRTGRRGLLLSTLDRLKIGFDS
ncbi:MAG TPA: FAD-dependent oxidoreductase [Verrucomicrobiae bacterium]|nr:FAD-dependent oxidoreductase [Verrucomicrobiae bacterium]